jgi:hemerythrin
MTYVPQDPGAVELGVPEMDAEHKEQLLWMNRLGTAVARGASAEEIAVDLDALIGYLEAHFMSEQIMMRENAYPAFKAHRLEHDEAVAILSRIRERHAAGDAQALQDLLTALSGWLVSHIHSSDRDLAAFARSKGIPIP